MVDFRDRRPGGHLPRPEDYETPLTRTRVAEADERFRLSGVQGILGPDPDEAERRIKHAIKSRFNRRRNGQGDFATVGDYLEYLNGGES